MIEQNHEYFISLEVAKLLRDAGFDWECEYAYIPSTEMGNVPFKHLHNRTNYNGLQYEVYSAPTLEVTQRWLREIKNFDIYVCPTNGLYFVHIRKYLEPVETKCEYSEYPNQFVCHTQEEALEVGIKKALELILEKGE